MEELEQVGDEGSATAQPPEGLAPAPPEPQLPALELDVAPAPGSFRSQSLIVGGALLCVLALFLNRAFNIDEPLFLWLAEHLQTDPIDFYDFDVHWYKEYQPMHEVTKNPPLCGYYLALAAKLFGWGERALHAAFLLPALGAALGTLALARRLCKRPVEASLIGLLTPVFLVSSAAVMCDTMMLAFYTWALVLWIRGLERRSPWSLAASGLLIGLCVLTKYFGASLLPLIVAYSLARERRIGSWTLYLLIPAAMLLAYQLGTQALYGRGLLSDAAAYASNWQARGEDPLYAKFFASLGYAGACVIPVLFFAPLLWSWRLTLGVLLLLGVGAWVCIARGATPSYAPELLALQPRLIPIQGWLAFGAGLSMLALAVSDLWRRRDALSLLLFLWLVGTFAFAGFINWTNNGRSVLPIAPVAGILIVRRLEARSPDGTVLGRGLGRGPGSSSKLALGLAFAPGVLIALLATWSDYLWSNSVREQSARICAEYESQSGTLWFQGHWGFQYYMERGGARPVDRYNGLLKRGDLVIMPRNNTRVKFPASQNHRKIAEIEQSSPPWAHTSSRKLGAGFYASILGPLPYVIGPPPDDLYEVIQVIKPVKYRRAVSSKERDALERLRR